MAGDSIGVYEFDSMVWGHHIYKTLWTPVIGEMLLVHGVANKHDEYSYTVDDWL